MGALPRILLNYRREDSAPYAGRIGDRLRQQFGPGQVFVDIDAIKPGEDFVEAIDRSIASCDAVVALIGKSWLSTTDDAGNRRLDRADDFVRMEIGKAIERGVRVVPALVGGASMPDATDLPQDIVALARRQAIEISDSRFHQDVDRLIESLSDLPLAAPTRAPSPEIPHGSRPGLRMVKRWWSVGVGAAMLLGVVAYLVVLSRQPTAEAERALPGGDAAAGAQPPARSGAEHPGSIVLPQRDIERPASPRSTEVKTGIRVLWRGANAVNCHLYDAGGEKRLSPGNPSSWRCQPNGRTWDAAPGRYQLKIDGVAGTIDPIPVTVTAGRVTEIEPRLGQLVVRWNGSNTVRWFLLDITAEKTLSPQGVNAWSVRAGSTTTADLGPGEYAVRVNAVGYQPIKVRIGAFKITEITIP